MAAARSDRLDPARQAGNIGRDAAVRLGAVPKPVFEQVWG
jgi:hypothetical protein